MTKVIVEMKMNLKTASTTLFVFRDRNVAFCAQVESLDFQFIASLALASIRVRCFVPVSGPKGSFPRSWSFFLAPTMFFSLFPLLFRWFSPSVFVLLLCTLFLSEARVVLKIGL